jgi:hypothetical protein
MMIADEGQRLDVAAKKTAAATPVDFDKKFEEPVAPNKLPDAPEPNAAPISAPLPCCSRYQTDDSQCRQHLNDDDNSK